MIEQLKVIFWVLRYYPEYGYRYWKTSAARRKLRIYTSKDTIQQIIANKYSISRFGDGELQMMNHYHCQKQQKDFHVDTFQSYSVQLGARLWEVFQANSPKHLNCLPYQFKDASVSSMRVKMFWQREWLGRHDLLTPFIYDRQFGDASFTRFYMSRRDIVDYTAYIDLLKQIWKDRNVLLVEGAGSRVGTGNDLLNNVKSLKRIICPTKNAFDALNEIIKKTVEHAESDSLILICLGHTATILAYDLSKLGYQAIDLGHVDIEYEWYRMKAKRKVAVPHKYVNEVAEGRVISENKTADYASQIVATIENSEQ